MWQTFTLYSIIMKKLTEGIYFDSNRGIYNILAVVQLAVQYGKVLSAADSTLLTEQAQELTMPEEFIYLFEECENYLNTLCEEGFYFGSTEDGDYGVFAIYND